jgi:transcriptional regulator with XRE-family HTH domain
MPLSNPHPAAREAARLLGAQIRLARIERRFTQADLAARVGVSKPTLGKIERGEPGVAIGSVLEAAAVVGVPLFSNDAARRAETRRVGELLALLPAQVAPDNRPVRDDF